MINKGHGGTLCGGSYWTSARSGSFRMGVGCNRPHYQGVFQKSEHVVRISAPVNNVVLIPGDVPQHYPTKAWLCFELLQEERLIL